MPFNWRETASGLDHLRLRILRQVLKRPADYYLTSAAAAGRNVEAAGQADGGPATCPICGFAMAALELTGGWRLTACSAKSIRPYPGNVKLLSWADLLTGRRDEAAPGVVSSLPICHDK